MKTGPIAHDEKKGSMAVLSRVRDVPNICPATHEKAAEFVSARVLSAAED